MAAGEKAVDAAVCALGVGDGVLSRAITLIALGDTFVGIDNLGGVGSCVAQACGLAGHIAVVARHGAADGGRKTTRDGGRGLRGGGNRRVLRNSECANGKEENGRVLHLDVGLRFDITGLLEVVIRRCVD